MADKHAATYHGIAEEFPCSTCSEVYLSPRAALLCEDRDQAEEREARREPKAKTPSNIVRAID